jgi:transposase-like protein
MNDWLVDPPSLDRRTPFSSRDISRLMAERESSVDHSTILRWVRRYAPEFEKEWHSYAHLIGPSWRVDEPYVEVGRT